MESLLRWGLFFIAAFVIFLIFYDVWFRRVNRLQENEESFNDNVNSEPYIAPKAPFQSADDTRESPLGQWHDLNEQRAVWDEAHSYENNVIATPEDIIIISVLAKADQHFASYDLLQAISATGMHFGEMDIFHYYQPTEKGQRILFSLASATKPGKFNLDHMGDFSCVGLSLFMDKKAVSNPQKVFLMMLEKAEQLADDLDGELRAGPKRLPWNEQIVQHYLSTM